MADDTEISNGVIDALKKMKKFYCREGRAPGNDAVRKICRMKYNLKSRLILTQYPFKMFKLNHRIY